ncbi:MAG: extradiol ring-cleavage dioxygenase [Nitrososphaerales archaeon]
MAEIVLGLGSSHTPQISTSAEHWAQHAARDQANPRLLGADGEYHTYDELLSAADPSIAAQLGPGTWRRKFDGAQAAVETLAGHLADARPDVLVIVGDDQHELFGADGLPAIALFTGEELFDVPPDDARVARIPPDIRPALWSHHAARLDAYRVASELSRHLATALSSDFDLTVMERQPEGRSLGHAFTFARLRLRLERDVPIVPVLLNTYFPPNVPPPGRCWRLGRALRAALDSWNRPDRVAVLASGGLSHFVVSESLDRRVLAGLEVADGAMFDAIPARVLRSGTSETLNWVTAGGMLADFRFDVVDYIPAYRSPAGTGCGLAFATWQPPASGAGAVPGRAG